MGFIAQEVAPICPEVVFIDDSDENLFHFLQYDRMCALLCEGIKEQQALIVSLTDRLTSCESRLTALESRP